MLIFFPQLEVPSGKESQSEGREARDVAMGSWEKEKVSGDTAASSVAEKLALVSREDLQVACQEHEI